MMILALYISTFIRKLQTIYSCVVVRQGETILQEVKQKYLLVLRHMHSTFGSKALGPCLQLYIQRT